MGNEWLELAYINFEKVIMHGQVVDYPVTNLRLNQRTIEQVLTQEQKEQVYDLNEQHAREMHKLLRSFVV